MYPDLFGIKNSTYAICILIGIGFAALIAIFYLKKQNAKRNDVLDILACGCFAVPGGFIFSVLFENLYELIALKDQYRWNFKMTFFGGLFGGLLTAFILIILFKKFGKSTVKTLDVLVLAPLVVLIAHAFGRIGCFFAGCCHGVPTDSWIGITFPGIGKVIPTQLIESIVLFVLFGICYFLVMKYDFKYPVVVYAAGYGIARFIIEFYRGDERGVAFALSPSQIWAIILFISAIPLYFWVKKEIKNEQK